MRYKRPRHRVVRYYRTPSRVTPIRAREGSLMQERVILGDKA